MCRGTLARALAASLLVHLLTLHLPVGSGVFAAAAPGRQEPAPLRVELGARSGQPPLQARPAARVAPALPTRAEAIADQGRGVGVQGGAAPSGGIATIAEPYYFPQQELSRRARILQDIDPYLGGLRDIPGAGKAVVVLWISEQGRVDRAEAETSGLDEVFEQAILAEFRSARFIPGERAGIAVKSKMRIEAELLPRSRFTTPVDAAPSDGASQSQRS